MGECKIVHEREKIVKTNMTVITHVKRKHANDGEETNGSSNELI